MRVPICVGCNALMEQRTPTSKYVRCPYCPMWFAVTNITVNHHDLDMKRTWVWQTQGYGSRRISRWVRVSRGPGAKDQGESESATRAPSGIKSRDIAVSEESAGFGDPVPLAERQRQWERYGRCGYTNSTGNRCRYIDNGHNFHLCIPASFEGPSLDKKPDEGSTVES